MSGADEPRIDLDSNPQRLPWGYQEKDENGEPADFCCVTNCQGQIVVPGGAGAPQWMNADTPSENEAKLIVASVNERESLLMVDAAARAVLAAERISGIPDTAQQLLDALIALRAAIAAQDAAAKIPVEETA